MALKVADRVRENTSSTGVGGISFTGSPAGFQTFSSVLTSGDITYYTIEENDKWEVGIGTYGSSNLERNYILGSSNSGNKISLGGSGTVFITYPAEKSVYRNQESQAVVGASGLVFDNGTIIKDAKITELYDVNVSGTPASTHLLSFDVTNKGLLIGDSTGPSNNGNVLMGYGAGSGITTSNQNVIIGTEAAIQNQGGSQNVHIGYQSGPVHDGSSSVVYNAVSVGYQAGHKMRHYSTAVGHQAGIDAYEVGFVAVGYHAGSGIGSYSTVVGMDAGQSFNDDYATIIGYQAGYNGGGQDSVWVGRSAGYSSTGAARSVGVGKEAGKGSTASDSIYIGKSAGQNNTNDDSVFIGNASPASMGTLFKGDMNTKRVAVGVADVSLTDAFYIGINSNTDKGLVVKSAASQSADLTQWTTSSDGILASVSNSGIISANGLVASGAGLQVADNTPVVTANTLYSVGGGLYWNGSPLAGGGGTVTPAQLEYVSGIAVYASGEVGSGDVTTDQLNYVSGIAVYSSGQAIANEADIATNVTNISANVTDIVATSGIAAYASGNSITNESDISTNTTNIATNAADIVTASGALRTSINTNTTNISTNATDIVATSGIANYASGQAIANEGDIVATSGIANYASGQAIANETDIATNVSNISTNTSNISTNTSNISTNTSNISTNTTNITSATNIANYASGQAIDNEGDIVAVSGIAAYASGHAHDDLYVSGVAAYASGNTSNIAFGSNVEGDILYHDGTSFTRLPKGTDSHVLTMDGNVPAWEAATGGGGDVTTAQLVYVSGIAVYGSGQAESLNYASGVAAYASGNSLTNASDVVAVSGIAAYASGHVHDDLYVSGIATYASGQAIANETDIATNVSNISTNTSNISTNTTNIATNADNIVATSGIANYASGLAITNESNVAYASGQAIANETDIATNVSNISTNTSNISANTSNISTNTTNITANASDIVAVSGIAHYASGHVHDDLYVSGIATYASGQAIANETDIATNVSNISTNTTNIASTTAVANYASGEALSLNAASGQAVYASGQVNVTTDGTAEASKALILDSDKSFSGVKNGRLNQFDSWLYSSGVNVGNSGVVLSSSTPSDTDNTLYNVAGTLYFNGTQLASAGGASPTAQYASGQAIENQGDIVAVSGIAHYASGHAHDDLYVSGVAAYASGQAIANETDIVATSGIANYASGQAIANESDIVAVSGIAHYASGLAITNESQVAYASGQAIENESDIVATSGIANYASGLAITNEANVAYASGNTSNITFGSNAEGDILYHDGSTFTRLAKGTDNHVLTMNGNVPNWEAATSSTTNASGAIYQVQYNADGANFGADPGFWRTTDGQGGVHKNSHILAVSGTIIASSGDAAYISPVSIGSGTYVTGDNAIAIGAGTYGGGPKTRAAARGVAIGVNSIVSDTNGIAIGQTNTASDQYAIAIGAEANATAHESIAIGKGVNSAAFAGVAIGGQSRTRTSEGIAIGYKADAIGARSIAIGEEAGFNDTTTGHGGHSVAIGFKTVAREFAIALGHQAVAPDGHFVVASGSAQTDVLLSGVMKTHLTMPNGQQFRQMATAAQTTDLMQWQNSAGTNVASMTPSGVLNVYDIRTSGTEVAIGKDAKFVATGAGVAIGNAANANGHNTVVIGNSSDVTDNFSTAIGGHAGCAGHSAVAVGYSCDVHGNAGVTVGAHSEAASGGVTIGEEANAGLTGGGGAGAISIGYQVGAAGEKAIAIGNNASSPGDYGVAIGHRAVSHEKTWVIASGDNMATDVGISGVFGSYAAIPNDQKLAVGSPSGTVPTYRLDVMGHGAIARASGVIVGNSGVVLSDNVPSVTDFTLYRDGSDLKWNGSAIGGSSTTNASGAIYQVQYNADGANFGADPSFIFAKNNAAFTNPYVLAVSGTIIANTGDANYASPVSIGSGAYVTNYSTVAIGDRAAAKNTMAIAIGRLASSEGVSSIAIGDQATAASAAQSTIAIGEYANASANRAVAIGKSSSAGQESLAVGTDSDANALYATAVGYDADAGAKSAVAVGNGSIAAERSVALGMMAKAGYHGVALGQAAIAPEGGFVVASGAALTDVLLSGVMKDHLTMPNGQQFRQIASAAQTTDLMQWQNSAGTNVAAMTPSGILNAYDIRTSGTEVVLGQGATSTQANGVAIGPDAENKSARGVAIGYNASTFNTSTVSYAGVAIGSNAITTNGISVSIGVNATSVAEGVALGGGANAGSFSVAIGKGAVTYHGSETRASLAIGYDSQAYGEGAVAVGGKDPNGTKAVGFGSLALGYGAEAGNANSDRSVAIGCEAKAYGTAWVIASGDTSAEVGISGVFGSYTAIPNDQKLAVGGDVPTYTVDALGHGAMVRATGVIVGNSGIVLSTTAPSVTTNTLYNDGGTLKFNGSAVGGGGVAGAIHQIQYNDGSNFAGDSQFLFSKANAAFTNDRVLVVSGTIIANSGDANYSNPVSIGSGAYVTSNSSVAIGPTARSVSTGAGAVAIGSNSQAMGPSVAIGNSASSNTHGNSVAIGNSALANSEKCVAIGNSSRATDGGVSVGNGAGSGGGGPHSHAICIGEASSSASYTITMGGDSSTAEQFGMAIGYDSHSRGNRGTALGAYASAGQHSVALGNRAVAPDGGFVVASGSALTDVLLSGVMKTHLTMPNGQQFRQMATAAQTSDLMQWQNSAGTNVASMTPSGILNVYDIRTSGNDVTLGDGAENTYVSAGTNYSVTIGKNAESKYLLDVAIGLNAEAAGGNKGAVAIGNEATTNSQRTVAIGNNSEALASQATAVGANAEAEGYGSVAIGYGSDAKHSTAAAMGNEAKANADQATAIGGGAVADGWSATALGAYTDAIGDRSVAIGWKAQAHGTSWVIASGDTSAEVGISGVFGSYVAIPNDQKLAVGGNVPTYTVDALGHGAMVRATGVIVGNSGIVLSDNVPSVTDFTLYRDGSDLKWNGSAIGGSSLTAGSGIAIVDNKVHFESKSSGGKVLSSIKGDNDNHVTLMVSGTIVTNPADAARPGMVVIGSGAIGGYDNNVVIGKGASAGYTNNVVIGKDSKSLYWWGMNSVSIGIGCTSYANGVAMGYQATNFESDAIAIGIQTRAGSNSIAIGKQVGWNNTNGVRRSVAIGHRAQHTSTNIEDVTVIGYHAEVTGHRGTALGSSSEAGEHAVALGNKAHAPDGGFVVASGEALTDVLLSGVMKTHLTMPNGQQFRQIASAAQTSDLTQWQNSAGTNVASMTPSGILNVYDIRTSGTEVVLGQGATSTQANGVAIGQTATNQSAHGVAIGYGTSTYSTSDWTYAGIAIGNGANTTNIRAIAMGYNTTAGAEAVTIGGLGAATGKNVAYGWDADATGGYAVSIGYKNNATGTGSIAIGGEESSGTSSTGYGSIALGYAANATSDRSVAIGCEAQAAGTAWVIASGNTSAEVGISGVFGSYTAIPNDQKLAVGGNVPTYTVDALGHGATVRGSGVIVGNSGVVLANNTPSVTTNTLYNAGGSLYFNGSAVGGGGAAPASGSIYEVQYNGDGTNLGADSDFTWNPSTNVMSVNGHISASTKSFLINHPTKPDKKLQYACLEGPENGVYVRGHTNDNLIDLPDYWTALVDPESITVQLTAKDAPQPFLYVSGVLNNQVHLISDREISAYYTVSATRKDVDPLLVEPDNY